MATAIALYGPGSGAALATVVGVLVEVPVMLSVCRFCVGHAGLVRRRGRGRPCAPRGSRERGDDRPSSDPGAARRRGGRAGRRSSLLALAALGGSSTGDWPSSPSGSRCAALGLSRQTPLGAAVEFFLYEAPKVLMLLTLVVFGVGIVRSFFTPERTRRVLAGKREATGNVLAALLGVVTPFCSCSAVPLFIGFVTTGVPLGVTFSFLVSAPMVNEIALALLFGLFGWKVAALYAGTGPRDRDRRPAS